MQRIARPLVSLFVIIVLVAVVGIVASVLLRSWLVVGALVLFLAAWVTRFVVSVQQRRRL